ncbi:MAG: response regulator [candidate division WOR-3 bacterium]
MKNIVLISQDKDFVLKFKEYFEFGDEYKVFHIFYEDKEEIEKLSPNIVLIDISHENLKEGLNILNYIKISKTFQNLPIIIISSYYDTGFLFKILKEGANDFIEKTNNFDLIKERIERLVKGGL